MKLTAGVEQFISMNVNVFLQSLAIKQFVCGVSKALKEYNASTTSH